MQPEFNQHYCAGKRFDLFDGDLTVDNCFELRVQRRLPTLDQQLNVQNEEHFHSALWLLSFHVTKADKIGVN
jgi:hypothetical protein